MKTLFSLSACLPILVSAALRFEAQELYKDKIESCAVGDIDGDGKPDVVAGEHYFLNPGWVPVKFRSIEAFGKDYMQDNGDFFWDVDGDGDLDVIAGQFTKPEVLWFENPGDIREQSPKPWKQHVLIDTGYQHNEISFFQDFTGDGRPDFMANSWNNKNPMLVWQFKGEKGAEGMSRHVVSESGNGHGQGFGDINGDGLDDIVFMQGWYEQPSANPWGQTWRWRKDFTLPFASCPILVLDLNGDGRNDLVWGDGHNYGIYWYEQLAPEKDGSTRWKHHVIDREISQMHALVWEDLDKDGKPEIISGKRYYAHSGRDRGAEDEIVLVRYNPIRKKDGTVSFTKEILHRGQAGTGLQIRVADLNGDGWKDMVVPGKSGTHILWSQGTR